MNPSETQLKLVSIGLNKSRTQRILEEYRNDAPMDPNAGRTAVYRILKSYFWVSNLSAPLIFLIGTVGLILTLKFHWLWAACLLLVSLFTTQRASEESTSFRTFKIYKLSVGAVVLITCYYCLMFDNAGNWGRMHNLDYFLGSKIYYVGGTIALVALIAITLDFLKGRERLIQVQRFLFVICTVGLYLSSNDIAPYPYGHGFLIQLSITAFIFAISLIKRKPVLAN
ncbi:MAG: hypothetical protein RIQ88_498 [Actinomycetota bacterium]|jgi:hypothetical protein